MEEEKAEFHSTIFDYLNYATNAATPKGSQELVAFLVNRTGLTKSQCKIVVSGIFSEIINVLLEQQRVGIAEIGEIFLSKTGRLMWAASERFKRRINTLE